MDKGQHTLQFKGIRKRKWGKWVSEIRMPSSRAKIWLGSYDTPEKAARAYDAALYCLRGPKAKFNFPHSPPAIPSASSLSRQQIQAAAARFALGEFPSSSVEIAAESVSPSLSSSVSEAQLWSDSQQVSSDCEERAFWESLLGDSDSSEAQNLEGFPSLIMAMEKLPFPSPTQEHGGILFDSWSFC
eukprot:Gb_01212 [translate_table: standard]